MRPPADIPAVRETLIASVTAPLRGLKRLSNDFIAQIACADEGNAYDLTYALEESLWNVVVHAGFVIEIVVSTGGSAFALTLT